MPKIDNRNRLTDNREQISAFQREEEWGEGQNK